jgi:uncharacterized protein (TIGR03437 family)
VDRNLHDPAPEAPMIPIIFLALAAITASAADQPSYFRPHSQQPALATGDPVVVNAASYLPGISPGGLATIFGEDLTSIDGVVVAQTDPLPTVLAGIEVFVNGVPAPIFAVAHVNGEDQINFQVPYQVPVGPRAAAIEVFDYGDQVASLLTDAFTEDPGIFTYKGNFAVAAAGSDGTLIGPDNPAIAGEVLVLYVTGLGPVSLSLPNGYRAPFSPLARTLQPVHVFVDQEESPIQFSGLTPGFVGLYQINFVVPLDAFPGDLDIQITTPFASSQIATLPVR